MHASILFSPVSENCIRKRKRGITRQHIPHRPTGPIAITDRFDLDYTEYFKVVLKSAIIEGNQT